MAPVSRSVTARPSFASRQAIAEPTMPPPMTTTSGVRAIERRYSTARPACLLAELDQESDRELEPVDAVPLEMGRILGEDEAQVGVEQDVGLKLEFHAEPEEEQGFEIGAVLEPAQLSRIRRIGNHEADAEDAVR